MKTVIIWVFALLPVSGICQLKQPDALRAKALTLKRFMELHHYRPVQWNDSVSAMLFDKWLGDLDEEKMLFTQKDIDLLRNYRTALDDEMNGKGWEFFNLSLKLYRNRLIVADSVMKNLLSRPADFSRPDTVFFPFKTYPANDAAFARRRQQYIKWRLLYNIYSKKEDSVAVPVSVPPDFVALEAAARARLLKKETGTARDLFQSPKAFDEEMQDAYLDAIAWCYDPHSNYMNLHARNDFEAETSAAEYSAGFSFEENDKGEKLIAFLQPGGSAWRSGQLHKGDVLVKIKANGREQEVTDLTPEELNGILNNSGSGEMEVTVRGSANDLKTVKLVTEKISNEENVVKSYLIRGNKNIGYINLPGFYSREEDGEKELKYDGCAIDVSREIVKLRKDNIAGLVLDLRNNGGGSMWEAMQLAGIFIDAGPVASVREKDGKIEFLKDPNRGTIFDGPMIVLVNGQSASASEFFSATLQDYNRALIVGGGTYGKGTAQIVLPMDTTGGDPNRSYTEFVKVTERKFYRITGNTVQWKGVEPDIELPDISGNMIVKEKANISALQPDQSRAAYFQPLPAIPVSVLRAKSIQRVSNDPYFKLLSEFIERAKQYYEYSAIPLQWSSFVRFTQTASAGISGLKENKDLNTDKLTVLNNSIDAERINVSAEKIKDINNVYLQNISVDKEIGEACKIMADWFLIQ